MAKWRPESYILCAVAISLAFAGFSRFFAVFARFGLYENLKRKVRAKPPLGTQVPTGQCHYYFIFP